MTRPLDGEPILSEILKALVDHDLAPTKFGKIAVNDARLVADLRAGRSLSGRTLARVRDTITRLDRKKAAREEMREGLKGIVVRVRKDEPLAKNEEVDARIRAREASAALLRLQLGTGQHSIIDPARFAAIVEMHA